MKLVAHLPSFCSVSDGAFYKLLDVIFAAFCSSLSFFLQCLDGTFYKFELAAYCPQQPWILNETIRNNITFGEPYDAARYAAVTHACALDHDIANLPGGHDTEIVSAHTDLTSFAHTNLAK